MGASGVLSALWAAHPLSSIGHPATSHANVPVFSSLQSTDPPLGDHDTGGVNVSGNSAIVIVDSCGICQWTSAVLVVGRLIVVWLSDRGTEDGKNDTQSNTAGDAQDYYPVIPEPLHESTPFRRKIHFIWPRSMSSDSCKLPPLMFAFCRLGLLDCLGETWGRE